MARPSQSSSLARVLVLHLLGRPKILLLGTLGGAVLAYSLSWLIPPLYTARASVAVDETSMPNNAGALGSLFARIGGSLGLKSESPPFIAALFGSEAGQLPILDRPMPTVSGRVESLIQHYRIDSIDRSRSEVQQRALRKLRSRVDASFDRETGLVSISVEDRDPVVAAAVANSLIVNVNVNTITRRKAQYAALRVYAEGRVHEARDSLQVTERDLTLFLTVNRAGLQTPALAAERARLEREVSLREQTYSSAMDQLEYARFNEARTTPVIIVVDQPLVPYRRSWPSHLLFAALGVVMALGAIAGLALVDIYQVKRLLHAWRSEGEVPGARVA